MTGVEAISAASATGPVTEAAVSTPAPPTKAEMAPPDIRFGDMLAEGVAAVSEKVDTANALVRQFAVDDTVPIHQVTMALEEARLALDLALQIRTHLIEGYREIMNMQL